MKRFQNKWTYEVFYFKIKISDGHEISTPEIPAGIDKSSDEIKGKVAESWYT